MARQNYKTNIQWIVVDDGPDIITCTMGQEYYRGPRIWMPGLNTQRFNMELALSKIKGDYVLFIEDDDWYDANYLRTMISLLKNVPAVGEARTKYFNIKCPGHKTWGNTVHSPLAATGIHKMYIPQMRAAVDSGELYFDIRFWKILEESKLPRLIMSDVGFFVGMKGLPGRTGIGAGHQTRDYLYDKSFSKLKEWIGPIDSAVYANMVIK